jgi:hypothetical protein
VTFFALESMTVEMVVVSVNIDLPMLGYPILEGNNIISYSAFINQEDG